jgi:hypothetical protein
MEDGEIGLVFGGIATPNNPGESNLDATALIIDKVRCCVFDAVRCREEIAAWIDGCRCAVAGSKCRDVIATGVFRDCLLRKGEAGHEKRSPIGEKPLDWLRPDLRVRVRSDRRLAFSAGGDSHAAASVNEKDDGGGDTGNPN